MGAIASPITSLTIVYSTIYSDADQRKSKLRVTGLCAGNSPVTGEFPAQMASNAENVSIWWRHHVLDVTLVHAVTSIAVELKHRSIDQFHNSLNAPVPYPTILHSNQTCALFCSEWSIVGYGIGAFWNLRIRSILDEWLYIRGHVMETFSVLPALCERYLSIPSQHSQMANNANLASFFVVILNKLLNEQSISCTVTVIRRYCNCSSLLVKEALVVIMVVVVVVGWGLSTPLEWRHKWRDSVSNHQPHDCLLILLFRRRSKKKSKLRVTGPCAGNSPGTGKFPAQMASNAENVSIWWRHHALLIYHIVLVQSK